jgi:hypothetical protein
MLSPYGSLDGSRGISPKAETRPETYPRIGQEGNGYQRSADRVQDVVRTKVEEYRQYGQESLQLAGMTTSPEHAGVETAGTVPLLGRVSQISRQPNVDPDS